MKPLEFIGALLIFCPIYYASAAVSYYGKLIGTFDALHHGVSGDVYAVDARTLHIRGFTFDGQGPDAVFFGGGTSKPGPDGFVIPNEKGLTASLGKYDNQQLTLTLPEGKTFKELRWISVWSRTYSVVLGEVNIPVGFDYPRPQKLGALNGEHQVSSDRIFVVDAQTFLIPNFTYDGAAPDAFFWVGRGLVPNKDGSRVPDENGGVEPLKRYDAKTLVLTLPGDLTVFDIDWISIWCKAFYVDFGNVKIPKALNVPPSLKMLGVTPQAKLNCEVLWDDLALEIRWAVAGETIVLQLVGKLDSNQYIAFGPSGDPLRSRMDGADVAVAYLDKATGKGHVTDYIMNSKSLCSGTQGVCPDVNLRGGANNVRLLNAALINDYVMLTYQRPLRASDEHDRPLLTNTSQPIVWAVGKINSQGLPTYHSLRTRGDMFIDFGRTPQWNCPAPEDASGTADDASANGNNAVAVTPSAPRPVDKSVVAVKPWTIPPIQCYEPENRLFYAHIGPTGGDRGYNAITGHVGWGISWYMNGLLIPEINVVRGQQYTFVVEGGDNPDRSARYHPFYITDDPEGGYAHKTPAERSKIRVFAGVRYDRDGNPAPAGAGRLCEWVEDPAHPAQALKSFGAYQRTLKLNCEEGQPGIVQWTPDENTPDTVYYQCYTHRFLGWKINVLDNCEGKPKNEATRPTLPPRPPTTTTTTPPPPVKDGIGVREGFDYDYEDDFPQYNNNEQHTGSSQNVPVQTKHPATHYQPDDYQEVKPYRESQANPHNPSFDSFPTFSNFPSNFGEFFEGKPFFGDTPQRGPNNRPQYSNIEREKQIPNVRPSLERVPARPQSTQKINSIIRDYPQENPRPNNVHSNQNRPNWPAYEPAPLRVQQNKYQAEPKPVARPEQRPAYQESDAASSTPPPGHSLPFNLYASSTPTSIIISSERPIVASSTSVYRPDYYTTPLPSTPERKQTDYPPRQVYQASEIKPNVAQFNPTSIILESGFKPIKSADGPIPPLGFEVEAEAAPSQTFASYNSNKRPAVPSRVNPQKDEVVNLDPMFFPSESDPDEKQFQGQRQSFEFRNASFGPNDPVPIQIPVAVVPVVPQGVLPKQTQGSQPQSVRQPVQVQPQRPFNPDFSSQRPESNPEFNPTKDFNNLQRPLLNQNLNPNQQRHPNQPPFLHPQRNPAPQQFQQRPPPPRPQPKPTSAPFFRLPSFLNNLRRQQTPPPPPPLLPPPNRPNHFQAEFTGNTFPSNQQQRRPGPNPQQGNFRPPTGGRFPQQQIPSSANVNPLLNRQDGSERRPLFRYAPRENQPLPLPGNRPLDRIDQQGEASAQSINNPPQIPAIVGNRPPRPPASQLANSQGNAQSRPPVPNIATRPTPTLSALQERPQFGSFQGELPPPVPAHVPNNLPQFQQQQQPPRTQAPSVRLPSGSNNPLLALSGTRAGITKDERKELEEYLFGPMQRSGETEPEASSHFQQVKVQPGLVLSQYSPGGFEAGAADVQNATDLVILKDVWSNMKVGNDKIAKREGLPDEAADFLVLGDAGRKLRKRAAASNEVETDVSKLPMEHRGQDDDDESKHAGPSVGSAASLTLASTILVMASSVLFLLHC